MQLQTVVVRSITLFLIIGLVSVWIYPAVLQIGRPWLFETFQRAADFVLDYQTKDYLGLESDHFNLKFTGADENTAPFILNAAEKYFAEVQETLNYRPAQGRKLTIVVYPDTTTLNRAFGWSGDKSADGVYWGGSIRLLSPLASILPQAPMSDGDTGRLEQYFLKQGPLAHELTHYLVDRETKGNYSRWLSEGLAQYIEREIAGFTLDVPDPSERENLYPLADLNKKFDAQPDQVLAYWESLQAVSYLIDHYGMEKMQEFLAMLGQGENGERALQRVYGITLKELDRTYPRAVSFWYNQNRFQL